ncbi:hypothetical protein AD952_11630, partial [Acetobacter cerevisiae]
MSQYPGNLIHKSKTDKRHMKTTIGGHNGNATQHKINGNPEPVFSRKQGVMRRAFDADFSHLRQFRVI